MALRLRKDVQKASYYVWFLGAQEARGLRGPRVLLPAIPRLIERSREQEPLKVTLQVSHKGLKIIQGSSKHFIPHSAITCSVQTDDVVACVLLLYNPATRCPLHVHAYRCDSETTAQALHQQLQILINRPENQKRFSELESRLGHQIPTSPKPVPKVSSKPLPARHVETSPRRFDSSLGSDTGTSTRESECSEEHSPTSPMPPLMGPPPKTSLYDSLAAELRAKLNGNGPPLLLPPRDYDTMHRSKGNLAATELRRCQNTLIVGGPGSTKQGVSSRGSSGIGSDLAPSPERQDGQSSSDEDWTNDHQESVIVLQPPRKTPVEPTRPYIKESSPIRQREREVQPAPYAYSREQQAREKKIVEEKRYTRSSSKEEESQKGSIHSREEEEVKPILMKPRPYDPRFRDVFEEKRYSPEKYDEDRRFDGERRRVVDSQEHGRGGYRNDTKPVFKRASAEIPIDPLDRDDSYRRSVEKDKFGYRENMTDKQKYLVEKQRMSQTKYREKSLERPYRDEVDANEKPKYRPTSLEKFISPVKSKPQYDDVVADKNSYGKSMERSKYRSSSNTDRESYLEDPVPAPRYEGTLERNPYREPESKPYRESIEKMLKSPVMRYKSFDDSRYRPDDVEERWPRTVVENKRYSASQECYRDRDSSPVDRYREDARYSQDSFTKYQQESSKSRRRPEDRQKSNLTHPEVTSIKPSPKDRFQDAKEKFQAMERDKVRAVPPLVEPLHKPVRHSMEQSKHIPNDSHHSLHRQRSHHSASGREDWSSDEEQLSQDVPISKSGYRELPPPDRYPGLDREPPQRMAPAERYPSHDREPPSRIVPSKSLGNLVKGYRNSYAEPPRNPLPRNSGRVGLAAVNPY